MDITVRPITEDEFDAFRAIVARTFGDDVDPKDEDRRHRFREMIELDRTVAAFDGDTIVGTGGAISFRVTVPGGGAVAMGGTTIITVRPTHRRRGVLTAMMRAHLDEVADRGEPLAGLWASETAIYGRFGYGLASQHHEVTVDGRGVHFLGDDPPGSVRFVELDEAQNVIPGVYDRIRVSRAGMLSRSPVWWTNRRFYDPTDWREGASARRWVVYEEDGRIDGYCAFRQKSKWDDSLPEGTVSVIEVQAATPSAHEGLWRFLTAIDLFPIVKYWNAPIDDALVWLVDSPRRVQRAALDDLWIRIMDVPAALAARSYRTNGSLVLGVRDGFRPEADGSYRLTVRDGNGKCVRTDDEPDVTLDIADLGALYLGGHRPEPIAAAGRIAGGDGAIALLGDLMSWPIAPWCPEVF